MNKSAAFMAGVHTSFEKAALLGSSLLRAKKAPLKMSFKGHTQAIKGAVGAKKTVSQAGVVTRRKFDPMTQTIKQKSHVTGVPGWTG